VGDGLEEGESTSLREPSELRANIAKSSGSSLAEFDVFVFDFLLSRLEIMSNLALFAGDIKAGTCPLAKVIERGGEDLRLPELEDSAWALRSSLGRMMVSPVRRSW